MDGMKEMNWQFLAAAEKEHVLLLTLDKKLYEKTKANRNVRLV
jgi:predicted nucleic acid-binding protein